MNTASFKRWLADQITFYRGLDEYANPDDGPYAVDLLEEAYQKAIDLGLADCAAACKPGPITIRLLEIMEAIPEPDRDTITPPEIAEQLSVSSDTVLGWIRTRELLASNIAARTSARPRWVVKKTDLDTFLKNRQPEPAKKPVQVATSFKRYST